MILPIDFENQMQSLLNEEYGSFRQSYEEPYYSAIRRNNRKIDEKSLADILGVSMDDYILSRTEWEHLGVYYVDEKSQEKDVSGDEEVTICRGGLRLQQPGKSPYHEAGLYYIQEPSAMLPVSLLDVDDSGMRVLDLCASPGGKTTQIADYMDGKGILVANEIVMQRAKILSENMERMGVSNGLVISHDPREIADRFEGYFDRILVDAPCSGEGMFRKHPEGISEWSRENVEICAERQSWILDCAAKMLKPGGRMVYSTCTFNTSENEKSVEGFLNRHSDMSLDGNVHRLFPHKNRGEGHFAAAFIKDGIITRNDKGITQQSDRADLYSVFFDFVKESLTSEGRIRLFGDDVCDVKKINNIFIMFGDQLYMVPKGTPAIKGIKVLRPGLHLGTVVKKRFEPSHALALCLRKTDAVSTCDISIEDAVRYLKGETLASDRGRGWTLVTVSGYSLGWGKIANNILKNHYPKGLRWM